MLTQLSSALDSAILSESVKVIILRGAPSSFCAGHNLKELTEHRADVDCGRAFFSKVLEECAKSYSIQNSIKHSPGSPDLLWIAYILGDQI
ncbi:hypothetical protein CYMTET_29011 [Cymbomonas tetramitiformis]|uniref:Uncharacterized protein n=1 Tax=Cymbomonas tetramitiformis TaxID=36881 RepID=A0AAE0FLP1_9CHLO|nr:hypothetical protein CYMTET_29011 [Cymbomonas tetramitiformis]